LQLVLRVAQPSQRANEVWYALPIMPFWAKMGQSVAAWRHVRARKKPLD